MAVKNRTSDRDLRVSDEIEVARALGISRTRVYQLEHRALRAIYLAASGQAEPGRAAGVRRQRRR